MLVTWYFPAFACFVPELGWCCPNSMGKRGDVGAPCGPMGVVVKRLRAPVVGVSWLQATVRVLHGVPRPRGVLASCVVYEQTDAPLGDVGYMPMCTSSLLQHRPGGKPAEESVKLAVA